MNNGVKNSPKVVPAEGKPSTIAATVETQEGGANGAGKIPGQSRGPARTNPPRQLRGGPAL